MTGDRSKRKWTRGLLSPQKSHWRPQMTAEVRQTPSNVIALKIESSCYGRLQVNAIARKTRLKRYIRALPFKKA